MIRIGEWLGGLVIAYPIETVAVLATACAIAYGFAGWKLYRIATRKPTAIWLTEPRRRPNGGR